MLNKLHIQNCFTHKDTTIGFDKGVTRVSGANESGKSLIFEMVRFALFGSKSLRGSANDYKSTRVTLHFTVAGEAYSVFRTTTTAILHKGDDFVARSTTAVNKKIIEIIGYGLKTFDNVNNINQSQIEKLTELRAEDRKRFLDDLLNATQIDTLVKEYKAEADILTAEIKALNLGVRHVAEPEKPNDYEDLAGLDAQIDTLRQRLSALSKDAGRKELLERQARAIIVVPDPYPDQTEEELNERVRVSEQARDTREKISRVLPYIARMYHDKIEVSDYGALVAHCALVNSLAGHTKPRLSESEIAGTQKKLEEQANWLKIQSLREKIAELENCPRCGMSFDAEKAPLVQMINELEPKARPHRSLPSPESLVEAEEAWKAWREVQAKREALDPSLEVAARYMDYNPRLSEKQFREIWDEYARADVPVVKDVYASINAKRHKIEKDSLLAEAATIDLTEMEKLEDDLTAVRLLRNRVAEYEASLRFWKEAEEKNEELKTQIEDKRVDLEATQSVVKALTEFKYYINTYFLPAVAKSASAMLKTMTNGVRKKVIISDKFEIVVDGQEVATLSGSAKALVNIALRLALQYVLTKNNFSVFMGDEIDAAMDDNRARYLSECLSNMADHIEQIIVISHRDIAFDQEITL